MDKVILNVTQASNLTKVLSNKTAQNIIDYINENEGVTATQIAKALKLPASTVHYNLKALTDAKVLDDTNFQYSSKGRVVPNYAVANRLIVIAPRNNFNIPALIPGIVGVGILGLVYFFKSKQSALLNVGAQDTALMAKAAPAANDVAIRSFAESAPEQAIASSSSMPDFLLGLIVASVIILSFFLIYSFIKRTINK